MADGVSDARQVYESLWREAIPWLEQGKPGLDSHLLNRTADARRGVTLAFRLDSSVQNAISDFAQKLKAFAPYQHFYLPEELHVTLLAIISGTPQWRKEIRHLPKYRAIIGEVLQEQQAFSIQFRGATASRSAVMIQGFSEDKALANIRDELREKFAQNDFGDQIDRRYKIKTAHVTIMRFSHSNADWNRLTDLLKASRTLDFGETWVRKVQLLWGDWYASADIVRTLQEYSLK
jgi:2'-5' RNA ligase